MRTTVREKEECGAPDFNDPPPTSPAFAELDAHHVSAAAYCFYLGVSAMARKTTPRGKKVDLVYLANRPRACWCDIGRGRGGGGKEDPFGRVEDQVCEG